MSALTRNRGKIVLPIVSIAHERVLMSPHCNSLAPCILLVLLFPMCLSAIDLTEGFAISPWLSVSGNFDGGYRKTQFFEADHNAAVGQWDTRLEFWMPPFRETFSYGPYLRFAGIAATRKEAWENALLSAPGIGFQVYPFSSPRFRESNSVIGRVFGPTRLYAEYNRVTYWGPENHWRPDEQIRFGAEYWRARHVNDLASPWWMEVWTGLSWQSSNEFDSHYNATIFANALRAGLRKPNAGFLSTLTPYAALESSFTDNKAYYWENRLLVEGGI